MDPFEALRDVSPQRKQCEQRKVLSHGKDKVPVCGEDGVVAYVAPGKEREVRNDYFVC